MRSLFVKIFLWFWVATLLVAGVFAAFDVWGHSREVEGRFRRMLDSVLKPHAERAVEAWERDGAAGLRDSTSELSRMLKLEPLLFDPQDRELTGQEIPAEVGPLLAAARASGRVEMQHGGPRPLVAIPVDGAHQQKYVFVAEFPRRRSPPRPDWYSDPGKLAMRLGAAVIIVGVVCYALARYLTGPIRHLRTAARRLADGDLSARVGGQARRRDEIGELGRDFDFMAERIETLLSTQRQLLRDISHELRSPLARLNVALGLARQQAGTSATGPLDRIECEAERLNELIGQVLTLARLESGADRPDRADVDLAALVQQVATDTDFEAAARGRHVRVVHCDACRLHGVRDLLRSALENVVRNAAQYAPENTDIEIALTVPADATPQRATIEIRDHGPGVPEQALEAIFRPFYRVAQARDRATGGTGLGLAIADRAIRFHGGTVTAINATGGGLLVRLELPLSASPNSTLQ